jgi:CcmD family protein
MSDANWLALGFGIVWVVIGLYLLRIAMTQRSIERRLDELGGRERRSQAPPGE